MAVVVPLNALKESSKEILRGVAQAQYEFNKQGGLKGRLLNIRIADDNNDPSPAQTVAQELIKDSNVLGVIGHSASAVSKVALPEYKNAGLAMISSSSTSTELSMKEFNVFFRTIPSDKRSGERLAKYAINQGIKRVVIYYQKNDSYSESLKNVFAKSLTDRGGIVVRTKDSADQNLDAFAEASHTVLEDQADAVVFFPKTELIPTVINIVHEQQKIQAKLQKQKKLQLLGGDTLYAADTLRRGQKAIEGLVLAIPSFNKRPNSKNFAERACKRWEGEVNWRTAASFDATQAFIKAMSQSDNPSRSTVLEKLKSITLSPSETSGGELKFKDGERDQEPVLVKVVKGSGDRCGGFLVGGFHFEKVPEK